MTEICRLCLSVSGKMQNLFHNSEIAVKIKSCLQLEIQYEDSLPDQICEHCADRIYSIDKFLLSVQENQNLLYSHLRLGNDHLENFYTLLKNVKEEDKYILKTEANEANDSSSIKEFVQNTQTEEHNYIYFKQEHDNEEMHDYSSDDNTALIAFKETKEKALNNTGQIIEEKHKAKKEKSKKSLSKKNTKRTFFHSGKHNFNLEQYKCCTCFELVDSHKDLTQHYKDKHKPVNLPKPDKNNFTITEVDGNKIFKCNLCVKTYNNKKQVNAHIELTHQDNRPYICNECGRTFKVIRLIILHSRAHSGVKYHCMYKCGYSTVYPANLDSHEKRHRKEYRYKCEKCDKGFESKNQYNEHQNFHNGVKPFVCSVCGHSFVHSHHLDNHTREFHPKVNLGGETRLICKHCSKPYAYKIQLLRHLAAEHGFEQKFLCDVCGKSFDRKSSLAVHKRVHQSVKKYVCSTCNKAFSTNHHLKRHTLTTHIGYKKYECPKCGKKYRDQSTLKKHESRVHPKDKICTANSD